MTGSSSVVSEACNNSRGTSSANSQTEDSNLEKSPTPDPNHIPDFTEAEMNEHDVSTRSSFVFGCCS